LVEILLTIVIIGLTITALVSSLGTVSNAGNSQRNSVQVDAVLRNYAEAIKSATHDCVAGSTYTVGYVAPSPLAVSVLPTGNICPSVTSPQLLQLTVTGPTGPARTMQIKVSTP
jgi:type II secretory pathway pseudopilin PulG